MALSEQANGDSLPEPAGLPADTRPNLPAAGGGRPGWPSFANDPAVIDATATRDGLATRLAVIRMELSARETALGLKAGASASQIEALAAKLIAAGQDESQIDRLEDLRRSERRTSAALDIAAKALGDVATKARRDAALEARDAIYLPAVREAAGAYLAMVKASYKLHELYVQLHHAGLGAFIEQYFGTVVVRVDVNTRHEQLVALVQRGALDRERVVLELPGVNI